MKTLPDHLLDEVKRALVVTDCVAIIDSEVQKKKGVTGFAIKSAYKIVKKMEGGKMIPNAVNDLLPERRVPQSVVENTLAMRIVSGEEPLQDIEAITSSIEVDTWMNSDQKAA